MRSVQMVYVGIAAIIIIMLLLFVFNKLPEGSEVSGSTDSPADNEVSYAKLFSYRHFRLGALSQFLYIAAQVGAGAFFINYSVDHWSEVTDSQAAFFFSIALVAFMIGRVVTTPLLKKFRPGCILGVYSLINVCIMILLNILTGSVSVFTLIASFFFMSISFPTIFALSITDIPDALVKTASSVLIMTIVGGAIMPYFMGLVADHHNIETSFLLLIPCFLFVAWYGFFGSCPKVMK